MNNTQAPDDGQDLTEADRAVIVLTGGREYVPARNADQRLIEAVVELNAVAAFEGDARGLDVWAARVLRRAHHQRKISCGVHTIPALWHADGSKKAGPIRNGRMLRWACDLAADLGAEVVVLAYPGGRGTANMCERASEAGIKVVEMERGLRVVPDRRKR